MNIVNHRTPKDGLSLTSETPEKKDTLETMPISELAELLFQTERNLVVLRMALLDRFVKQYEPAKKSTIIKV